MSDPYTVNGDGTDTKINIKNDIYVECGYSGFNDDKDKKTKKSLSKYENNLKTFLICIVLFVFFVVYFYIIYILFGGFDVVRNKAGKAGIEEDTQNNMTDFFMVLSLILSFIIFTFYMNDLFPNVLKILLMLWLLVVSPLFIKLVMEFIKWMNKPK